jgi:hypothetical protein
MKYILLATLLCGMFSSCTENISGKKQSMVEPEMSTLFLAAFMWEGHQYIRYSEGGLIHSESCKCKETKK